MQSEGAQTGSLPHQLSGRAGNIAAWKKKEGEEVAAGDSIAEIETDKARNRSLLSISDGYMSTRYLPA